MYFWNTKALAHELSSNTLDKKHYKNYYLVTALLVSVVYYYGMYSPYGDVRVIGVEGLLTLLIMFIGIQSAYKANGGDDGEHFLGRITALSFPILVQTTVAGVVFGAVLLGLYFAFNLRIPLSLLHFFLDFLFAHLQILHMLPPLVAIIQYRQN